MSTLSELRAANDTLPDRLAAAAMSGDADLLARVQAEQAGMSIRLFAAEVAELQREIIETKSELEAAKQELAVEGPKSRALLEEKQALEKRIALQLRVSGRAQSAVEQAREDLRRLEAKLETLIAEQSGYAETLRAPIMRSLWHTPKRA